MLYPPITVHDPVHSVMRHPAFDGRGKLLLPWDDEKRYAKNMTMEDMPGLHLWHTNMDAQQMVDGVNRLIDDRNSGHKIIYDFYSDEQKDKDPTKRDTGLFFLRGKPNAPFAVISAGGGFCYVGSLHEGFPLAMEINKHDYNAFVLKYRVNLGESVSAQDLAEAVRFIIDNAKNLKVAERNYSLWGGSAGARISSAVSYGEMGFHKPHLLHPAAVIMAYTTYAGDPDFSSDDPAGFMIVGTNDWIVPASHVKERARCMEKAGIATECMVLPGVAHGFAVGKNMAAEGWIDTAIGFWKHQMGGQGA